MFQNIPKRLKILCILTMFNTGIALIGGVASLISGPPNHVDIQKENIEMKKFIAEIKNLGSSEETIELLEKFQMITNAIYDNFFFYTSISAFIALTGLFSAILMLKKNIYGFHLYIMYSLFSSASLYLIISPDQLPTAVVVVNLILSGIFIFLYSKHIKWFGDDSNNELLNNEH